MLDVLFMRFVGLFGKGMRVADRQAFAIEDDFADGDRILDLGGGGEGVTGRLRGSQVVAVDIRKDELDEAPGGPVKVVADARALPFEDASFDAATAFFFIMYLRPEDRGTVLKEAARVLKPGGALRVWDAVIPERGDDRRRLFVVPVTVALPGGTVRTAYGTGWEGRAMDAGAIAALAASVGLETAREETVGGRFYLRLVKKPA